jgi:hypothetical protein
MCWACEEEALWRRYQLEVAVERGEIPPGFEPEDFEAAGLPVPPKRAAETRRATETKRAAETPNPFACDTPDQA